MVSRQSEILEIAKRYIEHLRKNHIDVERAYLYGSYASGKAHEDSDIDIVVVSRQFTKSRYEDSTQIAKLRRRIDLRIQPLAYNPDDFIMDYVIPYEAMTHGIRIA
ncbi:MAG: nucleotidyltransferase domain-containing protein [Ignavibacteriae bacterium]|nr:nucleotidyltransferase domain-containing protein [Ignavibacteriota bacterium]